MKTTQECWQALIDGETLASRAVSVSLNENGMLVYEDGQPATWAFRSPEDWSIYTPPKWYDNIPEGGVLCWISDVLEKPTNGNTIKIIFGAENGFFIGASKSSWRYATPLTKQEIQQLLDNAPEGDKE